MPLNLLLLCLSVLLLSGRAPEHPTREGKDYALFFAVDDYPAGSVWQDLPTPISDAEAIASLLHDYYGFDTVIHRNPSRAQIEAELGKWQQKPYASDDQLFLFFTGHGRKNALYDEGFFVPANGAQEVYHLPLLQLSRAIDRIGCDHILLGIDACYSGNILKGEDEEEPQPQRFGETGADRTRRIIRETLAFKTRYVITSGGDERTPAGEQYSPLTNSILTALRKGVRNQEPLVFFADLVKETRGLNPLPRNGYFGDHQQGGFVFVRKDPYADLDLSRAQADLNAWIQAKDDNTVASYQRYLTQFSQGDFISLAEQNIRDLNRLAEQRREQDAWQQARDNPSVATYTAFIDRFPRSRHLSEAREEITRLEAQAARAADEAAWERAKSCDTQDCYLSYLSQQERGAYRKQAQERMEALKAKAQLARELTAWQTAKAQDTPTAYQRYLDQYPSGAYAELAKAHIQSPPTPNPNPKLATPTDLPLNLSDYGLPDYELLSIEGGSFQMGSNEYDSEKPIHRVTVSSFQLGQTEVTQALWQAVMGSNPSYFTGDNLPVEQVSWEDCQEFIQKLNQRTGLSFRLPTEAEWEYAAGGGASGRTKWAGTGNEGNLGSYAVYRDSRNGSKTSPVKSKQPNRLGFYDLSGNVWEWCQDWYGDYPSQPQTNPTGPSSGAYRVGRGGSWVRGAGYCCVATRRSSRRPFDRGDDLGFRLARSF